MLYIRIRIIGAPSGRSVRSDDEWTTKEGQQDPHRGKRDHPADHHHTIVVRVVSEYGALVAIANWLRVGRGHRSVGS